jgi:hypothetical protein
MKGKRTNRDWEPQPLRSAKSWRPRWIEADVPVVYQNVRSKEEAKHDG